LSAAAEQIVHGAVVLRREATVGDLLIVQLYRAITTIPIVG
jgi:hypothetical protein